MDQHGQQEIKDITIERAPLQGYVTKTLDALSRGGFSRAKKRLGYDDVMHDSMMVTLNDGKKYRLEKNHVVEAYPVTGLQAHTVKNKVPLKGKTNLKELMGNASRNDSDFWQYDPSGKNCQQFVEDVVVRNKLETESKFERQDAKALIGSLGGLSDVPKLLTDVAAVGDRLIGGRVKCRGCGAVVLRSNHARHRRTYKHRYLSRV